MGFVSTTATLFPLFKLFLCIAGSGAGVVLSSMTFLSLTLPFGALELFALPRFDAVSILGLAS